MEVEVVALPVAQQWAAVPVALPSAAERASAAAMAAARQQQVPLAEVSAPAVAQRERQLLRVGAQSRATKSLPSRRVPMEQPRPSRLPRRHRRSVRPRRLRLVGVEPRSGRGSALAIPSIGQLRSASPALLVPETVAREAMMVPASRDDRLAQQWSVPRVPAARKQAPELPQVEQAAMPRHALERGPTQPPWWARFRRSEAAHDPEPEQPTPELTAGVPEAPRPRPAASGLQAAVGARPWIAGWRGSQPRT